MGEMKLLRLDLTHMLECLCSVCVGVFACVYSVGRGSAALLCLSHTVVGGSD